VVTVATWPSPARKRLQQGAQAFQMTMDSKKKHLKTKQKTFFANTQLTMQSATTFCIIALITTNPLQLQEKI